MEYLTLNNGAAIPQMGYGVFQMTSEQVREHLPEALDLGCRHIDTANAYFNEAAVGEVVRGSGIDRKELFITSKLFPQSYPYEQCKKDIDATLRRMGLDYLDLLLLHQPFGEYTNAWKAMEEAVDAGKVKAIGVSNFSAHKVRQILDVARITPAVNQVEINPYWNQHELKRQLAGTGIVFEGWYPLGHGDKALLDEPAIVAAAQAHGKSPAQVALRWQIQEGNVVFPKTLNPSHMKQNLDVFDFALTDAEMAAINALPQRPYYAMHDDDAAPAFAMRHYDFDVPDSHL